MEKIFIKTREINQILKNSSIQSEYFNVYEESLKKTELFLADMSLPGSLLLARELFVCDEFVVKSLLEEAASMKRNIVAYNETSTLFMYIAEETMDLKEKIDSQNILVEDLIHLLSSDLEFEKVELDEEVAYLISSVREVCITSEKLNRERVENFLFSGVFIKNPSTVQISSDVKIEEGAIIGSGSILKGKTYISSGVNIEGNASIIDSTIGKNTLIEGSSVIINSSIGDNVKIMSSRIADSKVKDSTSIGPYAQLRPNSELGENVKVGNFVEVKNSTIGNDTKISHLSYVGDSDLGNNINVGCGVVFVNYNGKEKFRSVIHDGVFIGCNSNIVSPVNVGKNAFIAAGSTITDDIEEEQFAIARTRQSNKDGWTLNKKKDK